MSRFVWVVAAFALLVALLAVGLTLDPSRVPSPLVGKPMPMFAAADLHQPERIVAARDLFGRPGLVNIWASWCVACRDEHPVLLAFAGREAYPVYGINYKDRRDDALAWLERWGDPYTLSIQDREGRIGIDWGVYGVPETFVIDKAGIIRYKHIGPLSEAVIAETIQPLLESLAAP